MRGSPPLPPDRLVTLANWQDPPFSRWGFQHVRDLIPTARIRRGDGPARRLPRAERDLSGLRVRAGRRELSIDSMLRETWTDGFLVLHRGRVVMERYVNDLAPDTPHILMSVSKSIVSTVAGILVGRGQLDPSAAVTSVLPELEGTSFEGAAVQHLLDMRSGTRFDEDYANPEADVRAFEQVYLMRPRTDPNLPADACAYFATLGNDGEHGGPFRYRSVLTDVLGWVIERAGGARLAELLSRELWQPMGAEFDADITVDAHGNAMADGGVCATLRDLGRFGLLFLQRGRRGRRQVVPPTWIADTLRGAPDGAKAFEEGEGFEGFGPGAHYRNAWWVRDPGAPFFNASGINGQAVFVHGPSGTVVAKLSSYPVATDARLRALTVAGVLAIAEALAAGRA
jgi:hypothetical protein